MPEVAQTLALIAVLLLVASIGIWATILRGPLLQRLDGRRASNAGPSELASQVLVAAFGVSAVSAVLAIAGWIFA